jgi:fructokinase
MNPIVGIGELLWDVFPDGRKVAGGAPFNFAFHCRQLGHDAVIVSRVGDDELGRELRAEVRRLGLSDEFIQTDYEHPTGTVRVTVDEQGQPAYAITEDVAWDYIREEPRHNVLAEFAVAACFGTLAQRADVSADGIRAFLSSMGTKLRVFDVNLRPTRYRPAGVRSHGNRASWVKVNEDEFEQLVRATREGGPHQSFWIAANLLNKVVIVTRGPAGCEVYAEYPHGHRFTESGVPVRVVDTVGAGDAFTAAMVCLHLEGRPLRDCARFANHYAARVCEHRGATPTIDRAEVELAAFG